METISQANTFVAGDAVRYDMASGTWVKAQANSAENSEVAGVVSVSTTSSFDVTYSGYISISSLSANTSPVLFLDSDTAGGLTASPPSAIGTVVKPVLTKTSTGTGYLVTNYLGTQIGGSSTVAIDEIQPVGTIMPFAGSAIPDSWLECNGASYAVSAYPNLYAKLQNSSGDRVPAYGYVATLTGPGATNYSFNIGDMVQFKTTAGTFGGTVPTTSALYESGADIIGLIIRITGGSQATDVGTITVQIIPNYNSNTKKFQFPTAVFTAGVGIPTPTGSGNYRVLVTSSSISTGTPGTLRANANLTVSTVAITHLNTPDLRGRFALGSNATAMGEIDGDLSGDTNYSTISGGYSMGVEGGQEFTIAGTGVATGTNAYVPSAAASGGLIANMPPYTVVRYIIKATPYTRAAIIDGIDIPYTSLLVGDLRDGSLRPGGIGEALVFKTNNGISGTERMRLTDIGLGIGTGTSTLGATLDVAGSIRSQATTASTSTATGALVVAGGLGVAGALYVGGITTAGGITMGGALTVGGAARVNSAAVSTSTTTGALIVTGGLGVAGALYVGGITTAGGVTMGGLLTVGGGIGATGGITFGGLARLTNPTASTSTTTGALTVAGGAGIAGALYVGGGISAGGGITLGAARLAAPTGSAPIFGVRAWGNVSETGVFQAGGNIASTSYLFPAYSVIFNTPMPNVNYCVVGSAATGLNNNTRCVKTVSKSLTGFSAAITDAASSYNPEPFQFMVIA